jgi:hypothetical protein
MEKGIDAAEVMQTRCNTLMNSLFQRPKQAKQAGE